MNHYKLFLDQFWSVWNLWLSAQNLFAFMGKRPICDGLSAMIHQNEVNFLVHDMIEPIVCIKRPSFLLNGVIWSVLWYTRIYFTTLFENNE